MPANRRTILAYLTSAIGLIPAAARAATPGAAEGPFYPTPAMRRRDVDNDLVKVAGAVREAGGEIITLSGTVTDASGTPLPGLRIEIWQCDMDGNYMHPRDRRSANFDPAFQGFGHDITDANGRYQFRTIKPAVYPGRTPHIHVKILDGTAESLTTQFYIKDHPGNASDGLYRRLGDQAKTVEMDFAAGPKAEVNVVL